jgi:indolepyruvate ferredoxin oxidoreductase beta subunit
VTFDILLAGVGGQGVLSLGAVIALAAMREGLQVKQSEVHGMAQRGGAVVSHLRLADRAIHSDLVPRGSARLVLSMEPLESMRHLEYLAPTGSLVTSTAPVRNIPDYPELDDLLARIRSLPGAVLVDGERLARGSGAAAAVNMVIVGAAACFLPVSAASIEEAIGRLFGRKGEDIVAQNVRAFRAGRDYAREAGLRMAAVTASGTEI